MAPGANRLLQHAAAGAVVLACLLAAPRPGGHVADTARNASAERLPAANLAGPTRATGPTSERPTAGARTPFAPAVERWRPLAVTAARRVAEVEGVTLDPELLLALVAVESSGDERAVSAAGAVGLTQVQPATFGDMVAWHPRVFARRDPSDPAENLLAGALYLVWCARYLGTMPDSAADWRPALNAYNLGPSALREIERAGAGGAGDLPRETSLHEQRILAMYGLATSSAQ